MTRQDPGPLPGRDRATTRKESLRRLASRRLLRRVLAAGLFAAFVAGTIWQAAEHGRASRFEFDPDRTYRVARVVDGDTLLLAGGRRVRLLGVDTPETKHPDRPAESFGAEATQFSTDFANGRDVRLVFDRERLDVYGRVLAWVFVDGQCLNLALVEAGLSPAVLRSPLRPDLRKALVDAEAQAKEVGVGLWSVRASSDRRE